MFEKNLINKAFYPRIIAALVAALFIVPAYLLFSAPPQSAPATSGISGESFTLSANNTANNTANYNDSIVAYLSRNKNQSWPELMLDAQSERVVDQATVSSLLSLLLLDYKSSELGLDQKLAIRTILPEINSTSEGRKLMAEFFFFEQEPDMAAAMYDLILDAKLKDASLIGELIERSKSHYNDDYKTRLIDLIADHNSSEQPYNQKIEDFLADMSLHSEEHVRQAATAQWAWYVQHHRGILPVMDNYLFNSDSQVRQEIYEMIELGAIQHEAEKTELALALDSLLYADYLDLAAEERVRIHKLKAQLYP